MDHRTDHHDFNTIYVCDERASGPKSADTTISFLDRYIQQLPSWVTGLTLVANNAGTNLCFGLGYGISKKKQVQTSLNFILNTWALS